MMTLFSVETRLTKGDAPPPPPVDSNTHPEHKATYKNSDDLSDLTGSTWESKENRYAAKAVKEVAYQYTEKISLKDADLEAKVDKISKLEAALMKIQILQAQEASDTNLSYDSDNIIYTSADTYSLHKSRKSYILDKAL